MSKHQMIFCIVNAGFSEAVMDAARGAGAKGGTVMRGRGTANQEAEKLFNIAVHPDKELIMIVVEEGITDVVLKAINESVGLNTAGQGIAFSMPVSRTIGLA